VSVGGGHEGQAARHPCPISPSRQLFKAVAHLMCKMGRGTVELKPHSHAHVDLHPLIKVEAFLQENWQIVLHQDDSVYDLIT
jgi:hypothetical protein